MNQSIRTLGLVAAFSALGCSDSGSGDGTGGTSSSTGGSGSSTGGAGGGAGGSGNSTGGSDGSAACQLGMDTNADSASAAEACCLLCVKEDACDPTTTLDMCAGPTGYRKCHEYAAVPPACASASKAYLDCLRSEPDPCAAPGPRCDELSLTATNACN